MPKIISTKKITHSYIAIETNEGTFNRSVDSVYWEKEMPGWDEPSPIFEKKEEAELESAYQEYVKVNPIPPPSLTMPREKALTVTGVNIENRENSLFFIIKCGSIYIEFIESKNLAHIMNHCNVKNFNEMIGENIDSDFLELLFRPS